MVKFTFAGTLMILLSLDANADSCAPVTQSFAETYEQADHIVLGLVTGCQNVQHKGNTTGTAGQTCSITTSEILKDSPHRPVRLEARSHRCLSTLKPGESYLLFMDENGQRLPGDSHVNRPLSEGRSRVPIYLSILRSYIAGDLTELEEPWFVTSFQQSCVVQHQVGMMNLQISYNLQAPLPEPRWTKSRRDGVVIYTAELPGTGEPAQSFLILRVYDIEPGGSDELYLTVVLNGTDHRNPMDVTLTVGRQSWLLNRMEVIYSPPYAKSQAVDTLSVNAHVIAARYFAQGDDAEDILKALLIPSDVRVTATPPAPIDMAVEPKRNIRLAGTPDYPTIEPAVSSSVHLPLVIDEFLQCWGQSKVPE